MTHELKNIIKAFLEAKKKGIKSVLATVVALDGSSYRRPGVRMLINANGQMIGAVSGGCVEKEVVRQAQSVLASGEAKVMTYDGRYRLGCEGILYILIETFSPNDNFISTFNNAVIQRKSFEIHSYFQKENSTSISYGSVFKFGELIQSLSKSTNTANLVLKQKMSPSTRLVIIGAEHDAVALCSYASHMGWEVTIVASPTEEKKVADFPGANTLLNIEAEQLPSNLIDGDTAVMLMTHSYAKDLKFLLQIKDTSPVYLGALGPAKRREKLLSEFIELNPEIDIEFVEKIHGPAGLNIGAETAQEIAVAILAEMLAVIRNQKPIMLINKLTGIHD